MASGENCRVITEDLSSNVDKEIEFVLVTGLSFSPARSWGAAASTGAAAPCCPTLSVLLLLQAPLPTLTRFASAMSSSLLCVSLSFQCAIQSPLLPRTAGTRMRASVGPLQHTQQAPG